MTEYIRVQILIHQKYNVMTVLTLHLCPCAVLKSQLMEYPLSSSVKQKPQKVISY